MSVVDYKFLKEAPEIMDASNYLFCIYDCFNKMTIAS